MRRVILIFTIFTSQVLSAAEADDKPFTEWLWQDQLKPTLAAADDAPSLWTFLGVSVATALAHQHDSDFRETYGDNARLPREDSRYGAILGSGFPGLMIAAGQLYFDRSNGLLHARALGMTAATHITIAVAVQRERPNGKKLSFPSGHTSSSFATATSLTYAYGPWVGVPALALASFIGYSRIANNAHWLSDTIAGAGLGIFWARASARVQSESSGAKFFPIYEGTAAGPRVGLGFEQQF